jgi:DNA-binding MarR family transcriptional regulator
MHLSSRNAGSIEVSDQIVDTLIAVGRTMRQRMQAEGFESGTFFLLKHIQAAGSMRVSELAASAGLDTSTVSRHVTQLERAGLLSRTPDPDDRRAQRVTLSAYGSSVLHEALDRRRQFITEALADWSADDLSQLSRLLRDFSESISAQSAAQETA